MSGSSTADLARALGNLGYSVRRERAVVPQAITIAAWLRAVRGRSAAACIVGDVDPGQLEMVRDALRAVEGGACRRRRYWEGRGGKGHTLVYGGGMPMCDSS